MYEIEDKVTLSHADVKRLKGEISKIAKFKKSVKNRDRYFPLNKKFALRVRQQNKTAILHFKKKQMEKGIELNQEIEFNLTSAQKMLVFLKRIGIDLPLRKYKNSEIYQLGDMQIELNFVKGLGYFLEIETIVKSKTKIPNAKKALRELFSKLGFKAGDFERKYYLELLEEKRKNRSE